MIRESSFGVRIDWLPYIIAEASLASFQSLSYQELQCRLKIIKSARLPVSCPVMPTLFTLGACPGQFTSKLIRDHLHRLIGL